MHFKWENSNHWTFIFADVFYHFALNSLKWHFPLLLWKTSIGECRVSISSLFCSLTKKSHCEEILTLIKKQRQKELNIFLGWPEKNPIFTILENYARNNDFSNPRKKPSCNTLCLISHSYTLSIPVIKHAWLPTITVYLSETHNLLLTPWWSAEIHPEPHFFLPLLELVRASMNCMHISLALQRTGWTENRVLGAAELSKGRITLAHCYGERERSGMVQGGCSWPQWT